MKIRITVKSIYEKDYNKETIEEAKSEAQLDYLQDNIDLVNKIVVTDVHHDDNNDEKAKDILSIFPELETLSGQAYDQAIDMINDILSNDN